MTDGEIEQQLSTAIQQWEDATRQLLSLCYALDLMRKPTLWLSATDIKFLTDLDHAFKREERTT